MSEFNLNLSTRPFPAYRVTNLALLALFVIVAGVSLWQVYSFQDYSELVKGIRNEDQNLRVEKANLETQLGELGTRLDRPATTAKLAEIDYLNNLEKLPDAIWLDYYLKDMNGLAFMQQLKENPKWASIPVLVVSNSASPEKVTNMLALGAKKYILKAEYRLDEIIAMIRQFIQDNK